jgi:hypothetical protein
MEFLLVSEMLGLGLVSALGWLWAMGKVQDLKLELKMEKAKVRDLQLALAKAKGSQMEKVQEMELG